MKQLGHGHNDMIHYYNQEGLGTTQDIVVASTLTGIVVHDWYKQGILAIDRAWHKPKPWALWHDMGLGVNVWGKAHLCIKKGWKHFDGQDKMRVDWLAHALGA